MASYFAELERLVTDAVDDVFGERTKFTPKVQGRYLTVSKDESQPCLELIGVVDFNPVTALAQDKGKFDGMRPSVSADRIHVSYDEALFPDALPKEGDEIELLARSGERLRVSRCDPDGLGRLICVCARIGGDKE